MILPPRFITAKALPIALFVALMNSPPVLAQQSTSLMEMREIYQMHTPENFDDGGAVSHYVWKNFAAFYPQGTIARTEPERPLNSAINSEAGNFTISNAPNAQTLDNYVQNSPLVDGIIVLAGGRVAYESYPRMQPWGRHLTWSVTKVVVSTALAALEEQGKVDMAKPVEHYLAELSGTAWQGISLRNIVNMASGIACLDRDGYQNTETCIYRYEESLGLTQPVNPSQTTLENLLTMRRHLPAGEKNEYVSANTYVSGLIVEQVTNQPLWLALQELVWNRIGAEADALLAISPTGSPVSHGGLSARLRDIARFGQIFTSNHGLNIVGQKYRQGLSLDQGIVFNAEQLQSFAKRFPSDEPSHAAWQWDMIWPNGAMFKGGYSGQGIYIDPSRDVVIAWYGTHNLEGESNKLLPIARQLTQSGVFDQ